MARTPGGRRFAVDVSVDRRTVTEPFTPFSVKVDFGRLLDGEGSFAPLSVLVACRSGSGEKRVIPHALSERFRYADEGEVSWLIAEPAVLEYRIYFDTSEARNWERSGRQALVGNGDELRYGSGVPEPLDVGIPVQCPLFVDWDGDGRTDLIQGSIYANTLGWPYHGSWFFRNLGSEERPVYDDFIRLQADGDFIDTQVFAAIDWNGDGTTDLVGKPYGRNEIQVYLATGARDRNGLPVLTRGERVDLTEVMGQGGQTGAHDMQLVDFHGDGRWHLVAFTRSLQDRSPLGHIFGPYYDNGVLIFENTAARGGPPRFAAARELRDSEGRKLSLKGGANGAVCDWNGDGIWDLVLAETRGCEQHLRLYRNEGSARDPRLVDAGLLGGGGQPAVYGRYERTPGFSGFVIFEKSQFFRLLEDVGGKPGDPVLRDRGRLLQLNGRVSVGAYSYPTVCDWDGDGGRDIVAGNAGGSPFVLEEAGRLDPPLYRPPRVLEAAGAPIWHVWGNSIGQTGGECTEGYWQPSVVDWDGDGLPDLIAPVGIASGKLVDGKMAPDGRLYFYRNVGTRTQPRYESAREILAEDGKPPTASEVAYAVDWDGDGKPELVAFDPEDRLVVLRQAGSPLVVRPTALRMEDGAVLTRQVVYDLIGRLWGIVHAVCDWDSRGLWDILAGTHRSMYLFRNRGSNESPRYARGERIPLWGAPIDHSVHSLRPFPVDWDGTGRVDLLVGSESGWFHLFRRPALRGPRPACRLGGVLRAAED